MAKKQRYHRKPTAKEAAYLKKNTTFENPADNPYLSPSEKAQAIRQKEVDDSIVWGTPDESGGRYGRRSLDTSEVGKIRKLMLNSGQERIDKYLAGLEELSRPMTPEQQAMSQIQALSQAGASPGSYGGALGQLAGGALGANIGAIGGPLGAAAGGILGNIGGNMYDRYQAQQAFGPYEEAARRSFQQQTIPGIAERFAGQGALSSSAFGGALGNAAADLESQLATAKADYNAQQMEQLMRQKAMAGDIMNQGFDRDMAQKRMRGQYYEGLGNQGLWELQQGMQSPYEMIYQGAQPGFWERMATGAVEPVLKTVGKIGAAYAGSGPVGAAVVGAGEATKGIKSLARTYTALRKMNQRR